MGLNGIDYAVAATTVNDFYRPYLGGQGAGEAALLPLSRHATLAWGVVQMAVALLARACASPCSMPACQCCR